MGKAEATTARAARVAAVNFILILMMLLSVDAGWFIVLIGIVELLSSCCDVMMKYYSDRQRLLFIPFPIHHLQEPLTCTAIISTSFGRAIQALRHQKNSWQYTGIHLGCYS